jgi:hypothetical protein
VVTELTPDDADWVADLMAERRREYERYSPVFWRPRSTLAPCTSASCVGR